MTYTVIYRYIGDRTNERFEQFVEANSPAEAQELAEAAHPHIEVVEIYEI